MRILASEAEVPLRKRRPSDRDWDRIHRAARRIADARIFIDDSASPTLLEVSSKARRLKLEKGLDLLIVDYLQLMQAGGRYENRNLEIGAITRGLKGLAKELGDPGHRAVAAVAAAGASWVGPSSAARGSSRVRFTDRAGRRSGRLRLPRRDLQPGERRVARHRRADRRQEQERADRSRGPGVLRRDHHLPQPFAAGASPLTCRPRRHPRSRPRSTVLRPAWVEIDLDALAGNLRVLRQRVGAAAILAVVKADAYGHGAVAVARALEREGADWLGVALVEEGARLRRAGVDLPILVLGTIQGGEIEEVRAHRLTPAVSSLDQLRMWASAGGERAGAPPQSLHLKVDTGMHRLGLPATDWAAAAGLLAASPSLRLDGLLSHLAEAEDLAGDFTALQERRFAAALELFSAAPIQHLANSAAALHRPSTRHSLVRAGLALYGIDPARRASELVGVMSVKARLVQIREIDAGERVGYGASWVAPRPSRIGVVPLGYADGYPWRLGNHARAWIDGAFVPLVGAVSMDMVTLDLTGTTAEVGGVVTLMAGSADRGPTAVELAQRAGTVAYEILCHFGLRLPKQYVGAAS